MPAAHKQRLPRGGYLWAARGVCRGLGVQLTAESVILPPAPPRRSKDGLFPLAGPLLFVWFLIQAVASAPAATSQPAASQSSGTDNDALLRTLVTRYFQSPNQRTRATLVRPIEAASNGSIEAVAEAIRRAEVWAPPSSLRGEFACVLPTGEPVTVIYRVPSGYDLSHRYPLLVCMPDARTTANDAIGLATHSLGPPIDDFVLISPSRPVGGTFYLPGSQAGNLGALLRGVRRRFSTDTRRTFLFGSGHGGDAAWMAAIMYADLFTGAIVVDAFPHLPYVEQSYPLFLENLSNTPVLTAWHAPRGSPPESRPVLIAAHNALVRRIATQMELPIDGIELPDDSTIPPRLPAKSVTRILTWRTPQAPRSVAHWFRYPPQGRTAWLEATEFSGPVWEAEQLSIRPSRDVDRDHFITSVLSSKLGYLGASVTGQVIDVATQRCARIEMRFPQGLVDVSQGVTVLCNGTRRYERPIRPSIRTMLESAYEAWDFQRLVVARVSFEVASDRKLP